jgi:ankyrin repeat protein
MRRRFSIPSTAVTCFLTTIHLLALASVADDNPPKLPATQASRRPELNDELTKAIFSHNLEKVRSLLGQGAEVNPAGDETGYSPLRDAVLANDAPIVELLLASGADPNDRNQGDLPLGCAAYFGRTDLVKLLMTHGAKAMPAGKGVMPWFLAVDSEKPEVLRCMIANGADVNAADKNGSTALHRAAMAGSPQLVRVLLDGGADPKAKNRQGRTPIDSARDSLGDVQKKAGTNPEMAAKRIDGITAAIKLLTDTSLTTRPASRPSE